MHGFLSIEGKCMLEALLVCIFFSRAHYKKLSTTHKCAFTQFFRRTLRKLHDNLNNIPAPISCENMRHEYSPFPYDIFGCLHATLDGCGVDSLGTQTKIVRYHMKDSTVAQMSSVHETFLTHVVIPHGENASLNDAFSMTEHLPGKSSVQRVETTLVLNQAPLLIFKVIRPDHSSVVFFGCINAWKRVSLKIQDEAYFLNAVACQYGNHYICYVWDTHTHKWLYYNPCSDGILKECLHPETVKIRASENGVLFFYSKVVC